MCLNICMFIQIYVCVCVSWVWLKPWHPGFKTKIAGCGRSFTQHVVNSVPFFVINLKCLMCYVKIFDAEIRHIQYK